MRRASQELQDARSKRLSVLKFEAALDPTAAAACRQLRSQAQASGHHSKWTGPAAAAVEEAMQRRQ